MFHDKKPSEPELILELKQLVDSVRDLRDCVRPRDIIENSNVIRDISAGGFYEIIGINAGIATKLKELHAGVVDLQREIENSISRIKFYYNDSIRERHGYTIEFDDRYTHMEDELFHHTIDLICNQHSFKAEKVEFHKRIDGIEFDCVVSGNTYGGRFSRSVGIEFKDYDIEKAISQAHTRSGYTNVQYVVAQTSLSYLLEKGVGLIKDLKKEKIGLILLIDGRPHVALPAGVRTKTKNISVEEIQNVVT